MGWKAKLFNTLSNTRYLNAFRMSPEQMRAFLQTINQQRPRLIVAYAQALYELARFAQQECLHVVPQQAIITSAGTLYPFMRQLIQQIFGCQVFNRYGSREVGDIACERPDIDGLWVAPWGTYVEIVDDDHQPVPDGTEGHILVTSLINYAMPLVRYKIGDMGVLRTSVPTPANKGGQVLAQVSGRSTDNFRTRGGKVVPGEYFIHLIGVVLNGGQIRKFQIVQHDYDHFVVKLVAEAGVRAQIDTEAIVDKIQLALEERADIRIEYVDAIDPTPSGKFRYTISEVH